MPKGAEQKRKWNGGVSPPPCTKEEWLQLAKKKVKPGAELFNAAMVPKRINKTWMESSATTSVTASQKDGPEFVASSSASSISLAGTRSSEFGLPVGSCLERLHRLEGR